MATPETITVSIFDKDYQVSCPPQEVQALRDSAFFLDQKMREMKENSNVIGLDRLAVMAALNLTNDLLAQSDQANQLNSKQSEIENQMQNQSAELDQLGEKLDSALARLKKA